MIKETENVYILKKKYYENLDKKTYYFSNYFFMRIFLVRMGELFAHFDKNILILRKFGGKIRLFLMIFVSVVVFLSFYKTGFILEIKIDLW